MKNKDLDFETKAIHVGQDPDPVTGAVIPPIYTTSTYAQDHRGQWSGPKNNPYPQRTGDGYCC